MIRTTPAAFAGACILLSFLCASPLHAQDKTAVTVTAKEERALVSGSAQPIAVTQAAVRGVTKVQEDAQATPKKYTLIYTAPATMSAFTETIKYTDSAEHTIDVTVTPSDSDVYAAAFKVLFVAFVVALLLESGLAVLFNWRPFLVYVDGRGAKTVISLVVAYLFVQHFELDLVTQLVNVYSKTTRPFASSGIGTFITALVIAGGSAGVNNLLVALGFRSVRTPEQVQPRPPPTLGWVSVTLVRKKAQGQVDVFIGDPAALPVVGTISGGRNLWWILRLFIRDPNRFPMSGGFAVPAGKDCKVELVGKNATGNRVSVDWGPHNIGAGAIIDLKLEL